ncbi:receptor-type tyrosine-protein phosphatase epsilon-like [Amphiura filiformis]|uniref:receptor-type tyrosine-protein phosphatase epsilon-like n=1 Tax=Amphiura filiformis TaxID=82378 RepID=UPI003B21CA09
MTLTWSKPDSFCNVIDYSVLVTLTNLDQCEEIRSKVVDSVVVYPNFTLPELELFSTYEICIQARSGDINVETDKAGMTQITTDEAAPSGPPQDVQHNYAENGQLVFTWKLPLCGQRHGNIIGYEYQYWLQSQENDTSNGNTTDTEMNLSDTIVREAYVFRVRAITKKGAGPFSDSYSTEKSQSAAKTAGIVGGVVGVFLVIVIVLIIVIVIVRAKRNKNTRTKEKPTEALTPEPGKARQVPYENVSYVKDTPVTIEHTNRENAEEATLEIPTNKPKAIVKPIAEKRDLPTRNQPVKVEDLMEFVEVNKAGGPEHGLKQDFKALPDPEIQLFPWTASKKPENITKNRYKNIIPYDNSRVVLQLQDGDEHSDYINASYIDGYKKNNAYIASQGPNSETVKDHWRMIWQEGTETIVMVTRLVEVGKIKCEKYWPDEGKSISYGDYTVTNVKEEDRGLYVVRTLTLAKTEIYANQQASNNEVRLIKHFHYTSWPDMSVPEFAEPILGFLDHVNAENPTTAGPIVIHCSAGIGRTGTFITLDAMLKMAKAEGKVDIFYFVHDMRQRRPGLIQTVAQYIFVHDALLEALFCGKTTIPTSDVEHAWRAVEGAINGEDNHIRGQFQSLVSIYPALSERKCAEGKTEENLTKNRYSTCIPPDSMRPKLPTPGVEGSIDYINASFCHGHEERNMYLTTQVPLSNTVEDFWRLIYSFDFHTIVALHHPNDNNKTYGTYFPQEGSVVCGQYVVESLDIENNKNTIERKLRFYMSDNPTEVTTVRLVQYTDWSTKSDLPASASSFVHLLNRVDVHRRDTENKRVVVVDSDGVSRCGLFCAVMSIIDQIKEKQEVDVFRAVRRLKVCRHEMIKSMEQYTFCYEAARMYLQSFEEYANFM